MSFEENPADPLTEITSLTPRADGGFIVVDAAAARLREYDSAGRIERTIGRPGSGPGELRSPTAAAYGRSGEIHVVERGSPRHTVIGPGGSVAVSRLPGHYGFWLHHADDGLIVGLGTQEERFALLSHEGDLLARFGMRGTRIEQTPFWVFFVRERAAVSGGRVFVNSSFEPTVRVFSTSGDSLYSFGSPPPTWIDPTPPDIASIGNPDDRARVEEWARSFTVVTGLEAVDDMIVVQYGRHDPQPNAQHHLLRQSIDIYSGEGEKLVEGVDFDRRLLAGGRSLYVLEAEPPNPWTISVRSFAAARW